MAPLGTIMDSEEFKGKVISLRLAFLLILLTGLITFTGAEIYFQFQYVKAQQANHFEIHQQDIKYLKEQIEYERDRVDRKFKRLESNNY